MATSITNDIKPTILIVPGGWHSASVYSHFAAQLESLGYPTATTSLPSVNSTSPKTATCTEDSNALRKELLSLIEIDETDVVILAHSYGGIPAGGAAHGLSKTSRDDKKGGVLGLIFMSAFVVPAGISLLEYLGGKHAPYLVADQVSTVAQCSFHLGYHLPAVTDGMRVSLSRPKASVLRLRPKRLFTMTLIRTLRTVWPLPSFHMPRSRTSPLPRHRHGRSQRSKADLRL